MSGSRRPAFDIISHSPDQTRALGAHLGRLLRRGDVVLMSGTIGAGKTTFVQGLARALKVHEIIQSPTFTLVAEHNGADADGAPLRLYHLDLYRLHSDADAASFGFAEYLDAPDGVAVVEWPERARASLPDEFLLIEMVYVADAKRQIQMIPRGRRYSELVARLRAEMAGARA